MRPKHTESHVWNSNVQLWGEANKVTSIEILKDENRGQRQASWHEKTEKEKKGCRFLMQRTRVWNNNNKNKKQKQNNNKI